MITAEQITASGEMQQRLRSALEAARTEEERAAIQKQLDAADEAHRQLHQAYTQQMQSIYRMTHRF